MLLIPQIIDLNTNYFIVCHGKGIDRIDATNLADLRSFYDKNAVFLVIDYRGFGESTGKFKVGDINIDLDAAIKFLQNKFKAKKINLIGHSLGSAIVIQYCNYLVETGKSFYPETRFIFQ